MSTRSRLMRTLVQALRSQGRAAPAPLRSAIDDASRELQAEGMTVHEVLTFLGSLVEDTGRACGADRRSVVSGEHMWTVVHTRVLAIASTALGRAA